MSISPDLVPAGPPADRRVVLLGGAAGPATVSLVGVLLGDDVPPLDAWLLSHLYADPGVPVAAVATVVSGVGTLAALALLLVVAGRLLWRDRRRAAGPLARHLLLLLGSASALLLQVVFQRPGPPVAAADWTYPSGHAVVVTAAALTAVLLAWRLGPGWRRPVLTVAVGAVLLVSASRVLLGEHYLIDVVAAVTATTGVGLLLASVLRLWPARRAAASTAGSIGAGLG
ncbi:phosphatase PAP2 family protein [Plantactinospora sp. B5E13]|uniref:phosphatase PAP2 family protein n=1 Tax=Plantactinospora sp. B5E13 TaxID=3153758 RepID=UPI00325D0E45